MKIRESFSMAYENPVVGKGERFSEAAKSDAGLTGVRAVYPLIKAINSDRVTRNSTCYSRRGMLGKKPHESGHPVGYESYVKPYGKPVLTEHRSSDGWFNVADRPLGRAIYAGYKYGKRSEQSTPMPGTDLTYEGSGYLALIAAITNEEAINAVMGDQFVTVSIGVEAHSIIDSITGEDLIKMLDSGGRDYDYERGQMYDDTLCYWTIDQWTAEEISWVNSPSDVLASRISRDVGEAKVQMLLSEKVIGKEEFKFYDAMTKELVDLSEVADFALDKSYSFTDSWTPDKEYFLISNNPLKESTDMTEIEKFRTSYIAELKKTDPDNPLITKDEWSVEDFATAIKAKEALSSEPVPDKELTLDELIQEALNEE